MSAVDTDPAQDRLAELRGSAKGWHGVQLAALGFIGLCGVLQTGDASDPMPLQVLAGILVLVAFACACLGIYYVGRAASGRSTGPEPAAAPASPTPPPSGARAPTCAAA